MKTIALVGRTNVGKSTLFNRLCQKKLAIVHDRPGVTRDRKEAPATLYDLHFTLIDTAGLEETTALAQAMWDQTERAIAQADIIVMVADARAELTPLDERLAKTLRPLEKPVFLAANKCEGKEQLNALGELCRLGLGEALPLSAEHGLGMAELYEALRPHFEADDESPSSEDGRRPVRLAIVGRPNVGKSTLINRLLGTERLLTGPEAGVTRDSISIPWTWKGTPLILTDTAGLRRRGKVEDDLEKMAGADARHTIDFAEIVIVVLDAQVPMERQDISIAARVIEEGRGLILALNKWDAVQNPRATLADIKDKMAASLQQVKGLPLIPISGKTGAGLDKLMTTALEIYKLWNKRVPTHKMNDFLRKMTEAHPTPVARNGRRIPMKYITQVNARPPTFVIFSSNPDALPESYLRYLSNGLRSQFGLDGVPIRIHMRKRANPFAPSHFSRKKK